MFKSAAYFFNFSSLLDYSGGGNSSYNAGSNDSDNRRDYGRGRSDRGGGGRGGGDYRGGGNYRGYAINFI